MKRISCEVCGSHNILKQDNVFVCQQCGAQYSLDNLRQSLESTTTDLDEISAPIPTDTPAKPKKEHKISIRTLLIILLFLFILILLFVLWKTFYETPQPKLQTQTVVEKVTVPVHMKVAEKEDVYVPTKQELWNDLQKYFENYYGVKRATQPIEKVSTYLTYGCEIMTDPNSRFKWLGDYIKSIAKQQGYVLTNNPNEQGMEAKWRWHIHCFFNCTQHTEWPKTADFYYAGRRSEWADAYRSAQ
jgi:hypothetical protein